MSVETLDCMVDPLPTINETAKEKDDAMNLTLIFIR
jgi:hypothetical protein